MKQLQKVNMPISSESHPAWVRGLKLDDIRADRIPDAVAPRVGAWIETGEGTIRLDNADCRTPRGCVD